MVAGHSEAHVTCRLNGETAGWLGVVQGRLDSVAGILVAASLNTREGMNTTMVRCLNVTDEPITVKAGQIVGTWDLVNPADVVSFDRCGGTNRKASSDTVEVPDNLLELYQ